MGVFKVYCGLPISGSSFAGHQAGAEGFRAAVRTLLQEGGDFFCDLGGLSGGFGEAGGGFLSGAAGNARAGVADLAHVGGEQSEAALVDEAADGGSVTCEKRFG